MERESMIDIVVDELIINVNNDSDDSDNFSFSDEHDDDYDEGALSGMEELPEFQ
jgi:hypothetical protein